jgi:hypothetical protein
MTERASYMPRMIGAALLFASFLPVATAQEFRPEDLAHRTVERRAVEAAIWGMPIVATDTIRQGFLHDMQANYNDIVYFLKPPD